MNYIALKPVPVGGKTYRKGKKISGKVIAPGRVDILIKRGIIAPFDGTEPAPGNGGTQETVKFPVLLEADGENVTVEATEIPADKLWDALLFLQQEEAECIKLVESLDDDLFITIILYLEHRETVREALTTRREALDRQDSDQQDEGKSETPEDAEKPEDEQGTLVDGKASEQSGGEPNQQPETPALETPEKKSRGRRKQAEAGEP